MTRTSTSTDLPEVPHHSRGRPSRVRPRAELKLPKRTSNNRWSLPYSPQRRVIYRPHLDGRSNRNRTRRSRNKLEGKPRKSLSNFYRDLDTYHDSEDDEIMKLTESETESKEEDFFWSEEQTLFSDLMEEDTLQGNVDEEWTDLVDSLQGAFDEDSVELKKDTARAFVPTVKRIRECYRVCGEQDKAFGKGVLMLNKRLKEHELMSVATEDILKEAYSSARNKIDVLLKQLGESYSQRDKLWVELDEKMDRIGDAGIMIQQCIEEADPYIPVNPMAELLKATRANVGKVIAGIDEKIGAAEKEEGNSRIYTEEMLKGLLKTL